MSCLRFPQMKCTRNIQQYDSNYNQDHYFSVINSSNASSDIFHYSKLHFHNNFKTRTPSSKVIANSNRSNLKQSLMLNKDYSSNLISSSNTSRRIMGNPSKGYIVVDKRVPEIAVMHSKIIRESLLKGKKQSDEKGRNGFNEPPLLPALTNTRQIDMSVDKVNDFALYDKEYTYKRRIDEKIKEMIKEELAHAKIKEILTGRSASTHNTGRVLMNNEEGKRLKQRKVFSSRIGTKWIFITREMMKNSKKHRVDISKYASPDSIINNEDLLKQMFSNNLSYLQPYENKNESQHLLI